jgi:hypothetical protein
MTEDGRRQSREGKKSREVEKRTHLLPNLQPSRYPLSNLPSTLNPPPNPPPRLLHNPQCLKPLRDAFNLQPRKHKFMKCVRGTGGPVGDGEEEFGNYELG